MTRYRVSYLLVRSPKIREKLHRVSGLRIAFENDPVTIFEATSPRRVLQANRIEILEKNLHTTSAAWVVRNHTKKPRSALVAISYHPAWQAYVDGHPTTISPTSDALIRIAIPSGIHALQLRYERRPIEHLYYGLSLLALLVIAGGLIHRTEQRECRRTRTG